MGLFAFHKIYMPSGRASAMQVVATDDEGFFLSSHKLQGEQPGVEWLGGIAVVLPHSALPQPGDSIASLLSRTDGAGERCRVWRVACMPVDTPVDAPIGVWIPLESH